MRPLPPNLILRLVATGLLVALGVGVTPGRAAAECGDYVTVLGEQVSHGSPQPDADRSHGMPARPDRPCHGPNCSSNPTTPAVPVSPPVTSPSDSKNLVAGLVGDRDDFPGAGWSLSLTSEGRVVRHPRSIFHPPRAV